MNLRDKHVAVIGGGVAGLTAADDLARCGVSVSIVEKSPFLGGQAIQLVCKATDGCVKCGACVAEEKLLQASSHPNVVFLTATSITGFSAGSPIVLDFESHSPLINADKCNGCGICFAKCPVAGTLMLGNAPRLGPYVAIRRELCRFFDHAACTLCRDACPQGAITLSDRNRSGRLKVDAILLATGFSPHNPSEKPYGYSRFRDVVTNLDAERILREQAMLKCPSNGRLPERVAFIQCVGSRDTKLGHPWCSKFCCGSSLRMAAMILSRQPDTHVSFYYIDVQRFGKDFKQVYEACRNRIEFIRAIPGDIFQTDAGRLQVVYFDPATHESKESEFDMVVLSAGMTPAAGSKDLVQMLNWRLADTGFLESSGDATGQSEGIFVAGAASGPMTIAESVASAGHAAWQILDYLG